MTKKLVARATTVGCITRSCAVPNGRAGHRSVGCEPGESIAAVGGVNVGLHLVEEAVEQFGIDEVVDDDCTVRGTSAISDQTPTMADERSS